MISFGQLGVDQDQSHMSRNALIQADKMKKAEPDIDRDDLEITA